jgi:hypothetical protein
MYETLIGNKNAEKWDFETVKDMLVSMLDTAKNQDIAFIGSLLVKYDLSKQQWDYLKDKFTGKEKETVSDFVRKIEEVTETNLVNGAMTGKNKETMSIFLLKCKYGYQDKQVIEHDHKGTIAINLNFADSQDSGE